MTNKEINWPLFRAAVAVNLLLFGGGSAFSWSSPVLPKLKENSPENPFGEPITPMEESWIASLLNLGAAFGPFVSVFLADRIGRKRTLIYLCFPMIVSHLITAFASSVEYYYFARLILGIGTGCAFSVVPLYLGEIAENSNRGALGVLLCILLTSGTLFSYLVGPYLSIKYFCLVLIIPLLLFLVMFGVFIPESPYYWILNGDLKEAENSMRRLRNTSDSAIQKELYDISQEIQRSAKGKFKDVVKSRGILKGLIISLGLMFFQQLAGISVVLAYMQSIFDATGMSLKPEISSMIIGSIQIIICLITSQLVDRLGRKILLLISMFGVALTTGTLGFYFYFKDLGYNLESWSWLPILSLVLFMFSYNFGIGPLAWTMMGELFPPNAKAVASTFATFFCFFLAFLTTVFFPNFILMCGMAASFWLFTGTSAVGVVFVTLFVPETKGRSLQEIQNILNGRSGETFDEDCNE